MAHLFFPSFCLWPNFLNYRFVSLPFERLWHVKYRASGQNIGREGGRNLVSEIPLFYKKLS